MAIVVHEVDPEGLVGLGVLVRGADQRQLGRFTVQEFYAQGASGLYITVAGRVVDVVVEDYGLTWVVGGEGQLRQSTDCLRGWVYFGIAL